MGSNNFRKIAPAGTPLSCRLLLKSCLKSAFASNSREQLSDEINRYFAADKSFLFNTGRASLAFVLENLKNIKDADEVIIPAYTCFTVAASIKKAGLKARLVDIDPETFSYETDKLNSALTDKTLAVVLVYPFSLLVEFDEIKKMCEDKNVFLIEDAAQAMGLSDNDKFVGTKADIGFFSLSKGKNITAVKGGIVLCNNDKFASKMNESYQLLSAPSITDNMITHFKAVVMRLFMHPLWYNLISRLPFLKLGINKYDPSFDIKKMSAVSANICFTLLPYMKSILSDRKKTAEKYIERLNKIPSLKIISGIDSSLASYLRLPIIVESESTASLLFNKLEQFGVSRMYRYDLSCIEDNNLFAAEEEYNNSAIIAERLLTLPTHFHVRDKDIDYICKVIKENIGEL